MAYFSSDFASSEANAAESEEDQQAQDAHSELHSLFDPSLLDGPVSQPGRGGLLRRIELRIGSVS